MRTNGTRMTEKEAAQWTGRPVLVVLRDGSSYLGYLSEVGHGEIALAHAVKAKKKLSAASKKRIKAGARQARISGLLGGLFGGGGGAGGGLGAAGAGQGLAGAGGAGGGFLGGLWPKIKFGIGMLQFIMPLIGKFLV